MHRRIPILIALLLSLLLVLAVAAASAAAPGDVDAGKPGYLGSTTCKACHMTTHTALMETLHPWKLRPKTDLGVEIVGQFPYTDTNGVVWTLDQVDWVIGAKPKWKQRYIDIQADGFWKILPMQWNVAQGKWEAYAAPAKDYRDACAGCHTTGYNVADKTWKEPSVLCEACHGPGNNHLANIGKPPGERGIYAKPDAEICGACHVRGKTKDGKYDWPEGYVPGGSVRITDVFSYTQSASDWWFDNPDDAADPFHAKSHRQQYIEWSASRHAAAHEASLRNDSCLECHSEDYRRNPTEVTLQTAAFGVTCQTCHLMHETGEVDGQLIKEPYELCVECHNGELPESGEFAPGASVHHPMQEVFEGKGFPGLPEIPSPHFQADAGATCNSCHMPKTAKSANTGDVTSHRFAVAMPGAVKEGEPDSCTGCHKDSSKELLQEIIDTRQGEIKDGLEDLNALAMENGCPDLNGRTPGDTDACKLAFTGYKMLMEEGSYGMHNYFYAKSILKASREAFGAAVYGMSYAGSLTCAACHGDYYEGLQQTRHPWKLRAKTDPGVEIVGKFPYTDTTGAVWTLDQVDWVIGAHPKWKQRYVDIQEDGFWKILPIQWNVETARWVAYTPPAKDYRDACAGCHTTGYDVELQQWSEPGVTCESCHGPGLDHVLSADKANDPMIYASVDSEVCGACHTRGKS